ncbi:MAG TPA: hypothetical protein VG167_18855 [Verrucomicrobiae bacterium]|nr:hypothetical protein [Verrucomicrobiae bacterium]
MIGDQPGEYAHEEDGRPVPASQFDYNQVDEDVFGHQPESDLSEFSQQEVDRALVVLRVLLSWIWQNGMKNSEGLKIRAIIICWIFLKELRPMSLTELATGFGMKKQSLGRWHDHFKTVFKIRTPHMRP